MSQREDKRRSLQAQLVTDAAELSRAKAALLDSEAWRARRELTAIDVCFRCNRKLGARQLLAILPTEAVVVHNECA
jgi:hypothetical protein